MADSEGRATNKWWYSRRTIISEGSTSIANASLQHVMGRVAFKQALMVPRWLGPARWSAAINLAMRWHARQNILRLQLQRTYLRFVITRADQYYGCPLLLHTLSDGLSTVDRLWLRLRGVETPVFVPEGEDSGGGMCDRFMVCSNGSVTRCLGLLDHFVRDPAKYLALDQQKWLPERYVRVRLGELGLAYRTFRRTMFTAAAPGDMTRWSTMSQERDSTYGTHFKYPEEHATAVARCGHCTAAGEAYCCWALRSALFGALEGALGGKMQTFGTRGECVGAPAWWGRPVLALASMIVAVGLGARLSRRR